MSNDDLLAQFQEMRDAVKAELRWRAPGPLRDLVALTGLSIEGAPADVAARIGAAAEEIKTEAGSIGLFKRPPRNLIAAVALAAGDDPKALARRTLAAKAVWRAADLRRGGFAEVLALIILAVMREGLAEDPAHHAHLKRVFDEMKEAHFWHIGGYSTPVIALAAPADFDAARRANLIYGRLTEGPYPKGVSALNAAMIAGFCSRDPHRAADRMIALAGEFRTQNLHFGRQRFSDMAVVSLTSVEPAQIAREVAALSQDIRLKLKGVRDRQALATALWLHTAEAPEHADDVRTILALNALLTAQATAATAAASGAVVAAGAAGG